MTYLKQRLTPEVMVGRAKKENCPLNVTAPTIYSYIKSTKPEWEKYLPYKSKKNYKSKKKVAETHAISSKTNISERPLEVNLREELQHYEIDTIHLDKGAILSMVERKSRFLATALLPNRTAEVTCNALKDCITKLSKAGKIKSITLDNGTEFARFKEISDCFDIPFFHCDLFLPKRF